MRLNILTQATSKWFFVLAFTLSSTFAWTETLPERVRDVHATKSKDIQEQSAQLIKDLSQIKEDTLITGHHDDEVQTLYRNTAEFLLKTSHAQMADGEKAKIIQDVAAAAGESFERLTSPFVDPVDYFKMPHLDRYGGNDNSFVSALRAVSHHLQLIGASFIRDILTVPSTAPLLGKDRNRSSLVKKIAKDLNEVTRQEMERVEKEHTEKTGLAAVAYLIDQFKDAEPYRHGNHNRIMRLTYIGIAFLGLFHPILDIFGIPHPTRLSPVYSGFTYWNFWMALAEARRVNSGLGFYVTIHRLRKALDVRLKGCEFLLTTANLPTSSRSRVRSRR